MKKLILVAFFIPSFAFALSCEMAEKMAEYLNMSGNQFVEASKKHKLEGNLDELNLALDDVNQARKVAYSLAAIQDLGFPPVSKIWESFVPRMGKSPLKGIKSGKKFTKANGGYAIIRLDYDPVKGGHYNIEIFEKTPQGKRTSKLSISFDCNGRPCTGDEVKKLAEKIQ